MLHVIVSTISKTTELIIGLLDLLEMVEMVYGVKIEFQIKLTTLKFLLLEMLILQAI